MVVETLEPLSETSGRTRTLAEAVARQGSRSPAESVNVRLKSLVAAFSTAFWDAMSDAMLDAQANDERWATDSAQRLAFASCATQYEVLASTALAMGAKQPAFALSMTSQGGIEVALRDYATDDLYYLEVDEHGTRRTLRQVTPDGEVIVVFDRVADA